MSQTIPKDPLVDPKSIVTGIGSARTHWDLSVQTALALADIVQQAAAIGDALRTLDGVVRKAGSRNAGAASTAAPAAATGDALNVCATIDAGRIAAAVNVDGLGEPVLQALDARLSKAAHAVVALAQAGGARVDALAAGLDAAIGKVAAEICASHKVAAQIDGHLCELTGVLREHLSCLCDHCGEIKECLRQPRQHDGAVQGNRLVALQNASEAQRAQIEHLARLMEAAAPHDKLADMVTHLTPWAEANLPGLAGTAVPSGSIGNRGRAPHKG